MRFEFATATRIIFGAGTVKEVAPLATEGGKTALARQARRGLTAFVVAGSTNERAGTLLAELTKWGIEYVTFNLSTEPTTVKVMQALQKARQANCDMVISIGGGSVLDTGKVIAAMLTNTGKLEDYLEIAGAGKPLTKNPVPHIAIPTTAGTGAEVTRNAVIGVPEHQVKVSMRSPLMLPRLAVVDPELTYSMPPSVTASTGLDALTQLIEAYVSSNANPLTDGICREGLKRAGHSLRKAYENGSDKTARAVRPRRACRARENMALASLFSGLALDNAKLGAVHGFAGVLGGMFSAPHGVVCARLLPCVMETNVSALQNRQPDSPALARYDQIAQILTGMAAAKASDGVRWVQQLCTALEVPSLSNFGLKEQDFPLIVAKAQKANSMKSNPITLTNDELTEILKKANI